MCGKGRIVVMNVEEFERTCGANTSLGRITEIGEGNGNPQIRGVEVPMHRKAWDKYGSDPIPVEIPVKVRR